MVRAASWGIILSIWPRPTTLSRGWIMCRFVVRQPPSIHIKALCALTRRLITRQLIMPMGLAISGAVLVVISTLSAMCHVARCVHPPRCHWTPGRGSHGWGNLELWRIAAHKFERNVFGLHRPAVPASAPLRPLPHRSWWGHRPGSWKNGTFSSTLLPAFEEPKKTARHPGSCSCRLPSLSGIAFSAGPGKTKWGNPNRHSHALDVVILIPVLEPWSVDRLAFGKRVMLASWAHRWLASASQQLITHRGPIPLARNRPPCSERDACPTHPRFALQHTSSAVTRPCQTL